MPAIRNVIYKLFVFSLLALIFGRFETPAQPSAAEDFATVLAKKLAKERKTVIVNGRQEKRTGISLDEICDLSDPVSKRVFREYGAMFVGDNNAFADFAQAIEGGRIRFLANCVFRNEAEVALYQGDVKTRTETIGGVTVELQEEAMEALLEAVEDGREKNVRITPRGGLTAAKRSFRQTVELWNSRFQPGLNFHVGKGRISRQEAAAARNAPITEQVEKVLGWEARGYYFSKDLSKSILYSVAAPGASQHIFMLALDVAEFANPQVRKILARHGWFQTVLSDQPHFTYLGVDEEDLPKLGLIAKSASGQKFWVPNLK
jgi:hypothetical protein